MDTTTIGDRVKQARDTSGMTQQQLSERSGVSMPTIDRLENGRVDPLLGTLAAVAAALDVDFHWLAFGEQKEAGA